MGEQGEAGRGWDCRQGGAYGAGRHSPDVLNEYEIFIKSEAVSKPESLRQARGHLETWGSGGGTT